MSRYGPNSARLRVLAIDPSQRGFGFVVLEGRDCLIDWGVAHLYSRADGEFLVRVEAMVDRYSPGLIVLEDFRDTRRRQRSVERIKSALAYAHARHIRAVTISRTFVKATFSATGSTKYDIACAIGALFPELAARLPRKRTAWRAEDERMSIFDALALALCFSNR